MNEEFENEDIEDLFERYSVSGTPEQKAALAESYLDMFHEWSYDFSCGKLSDGAVQELIFFVEKIEILNGTTSWSLRAQAYEMLMEDAESRSDVAAVLHNGELAIECSLKQVEEGDELRQMHYAKIAFCHDTLRAFIPEEDAGHWKKSLQFIKTSILENPVKANWGHYFKLLYCPLASDSSSLTELLKQEAEVSRDWCLSLDQEGLSYALASALLRLNEFMEYSEPVDFIFPEDEYIFWLNRSLTDQTTGPAVSDVSGMGHFYKKEGVRLERMDLLEKALGCFEKLYYEHSEGFAIYYKTDVLEQIAALHLKHNEPEKAAATITEALEWNADKLEYVRHNFSLIIHYAEFLERCYYFTGIIPRPDLAFIKSILQEAEIIGDGYYSGPYLLQARMALEEKDERAAVVFLCKSLLLHELCMEESVVKFHWDLPKGNYPYVEKFIQNTLLFMKEVRVGYFYDPVIKFTALARMSDEEIVDTWILRKAEIKRRKK